MTSKNIEVVTTLSNIEFGLWQQWKSHQNPELRAQLFMFYSDWTRTIANLVQIRYPHPLADRGDYIHFASIGLLQALDRFQPELNNRFQSFAEPYVRGSILKGLSCYIQDKKNPISERLTIASENQAIDKDSALDMVVNAAIDLAFGHFLELGIVDEAEPNNSPLLAYARERQSQQLTEYVKQLPERERQIIVCHYYQHLSFTEISQLLNLSKARISQLHSQALRRIRTHYEQAEDMDFRW